MFPAVLVSVLIVALVCGLLSVLIAKAPLISGEYKQVALLIFILWLISLILGYSPPVWRR